MVGGTLAYATVGSNRLVEALKFYDALLPLIGLTPLFEHPSGGRVYGRDGHFQFGVLSPFDGKQATPGNGTMLAFRCATRELVDMLHGKAVALGGASEGLPADRGPGWYFTYFRDLDDNKLCAYCIDA